MTDKQDLVGLTAAEIEAANEIEDDFDDAGEGDDIVDIPVGDGGAPVEKEAATTAGEKDVDDAQAGIEKSESNSAQPTDPDLFVPKFVSQTADNIGEIAKNLESTYAKLSDELAEKYESGNLTFVEYRKESRDLDSRYLSEQKKIDAAMLKAEISAEQQQQFADQKWQWEQDLFFKDNPTFKDDPVMFGALNGLLQAMYADEKNNAKTGLQLLREAGTIINAKFNVIQNNKQALPDKKPEKPQLKADTKPLPKTLAGVPSAEANITQQGEFDHLDNLGGMALESAISRLTPEQQSRYLNG